jgi:hypothetical protein
VASSSLIFSCFLELCREVFLGFFVGLGTEHGEANFAERG